MTTSTQPLAAPAPDPRVALRLDLPALTGAAAVDGTWWPQSRDLDVEIPDLVDHFPDSFGEVYRVLYSRPDWDSQPRRVRAARGIIKMGSYPHDDNHQVWLSMSTRRLIRLSVTAPAGEPAVVADPPTPPTPASATSRDKGLDVESERHWNDEGDSWWDPHTVAPSDRT